MRKEEMVFEPIDQGIVTSAGTTVPFDAYVTLEGEPLQHSSRSNLRPFDKGELRAILRVGLCVRCHNKYDDPIWKNYNGQTVCRRPELSSGAGDEDFPIIKEEKRSEL
jgi:hypothetical protein